MVKASMRLLSEGTPSILVGETAFVFSPFGYILAFNDFPMMARITPQEAMKTDIQLSWPVHKDSKEGDDYDPTTVHILGNNAHRGN